MLLIGQNGAGKSTLLQALSFIRYFGDGRVASFFEDRGWDPLDLRHRSRTPGATIFTFDLLLESAEGLQCLWQFDWGLRGDRTRMERIWVREEEGFRRIASFSFGGGLQVGSEEESIQKLKLNGSVLSVVKPESFGQDASLVNEIMSWVGGVTSLELLSPTAMRRSVRGTASDIGPRGERLAGFLSGLAAADKAAIVSRLARYYPLRGIDTTRKRAGWIDVKVAETTSGQMVKIDHVSDGFLRLLALCAIPGLDQTASLVLLDEIEDGIEPHILPLVIQDLRRESRAQLVVTTHSPVLLNHVAPNEAILIHRDEFGRAQADPLVDLRTFSIGKKLFGPGEVWLNTSLPILNRQAASTNSTRQPTARPTTRGQLEAFADR